MQQDDYYGFVGVFIAAATRSSRPAVPGPSAQWKHALRERVCGLHCIVDMAIARWLAPVKPATAVSLASISSIVRRLWPAADRLPAVITVIASPLAIF